MSRALCLITGASSGIGQALAVRYQRAGYRLALIARRAGELQRWVDAQGWDVSTCTVYRADVRRVEEIAEAARACLADQGVPDVVIANAGISIGVDPALAEDLDVMRAIWETNNLGLAATFQPFIAPMRERGSGRLVGIASVAGVRGLPGHAAYCSSKAAVITYCESLRGDLRASGVHVVTILPGYVDTPLTRGNRYPMPFLLSPQDFADRAFHAIERGAVYRVIPWQMAIVARLMRGLPNALFDRLLAGRPRKARRVTTPRG